MRSEGTNPERPRKASLVLLLVGLTIGASPVLPDEGRSAPRRRSASPGVRVQVQGAGELESVHGAPSPQPPPMERKAFSASTALSSHAVSPVEATSPSLQLVSTAEDEATIEIDGRRQLVRAGSRIGRDTVKVVDSRRIVLETPPAPGEKGDPAIVIITFDAAGAAHARTFWTRDPAAPGRPEAKRP